MNAVVKAILSRHSVRESFDSRPIPVEVLEGIVRCGLAAPSSKGARPWRFHVVVDRELLRDLAEFLETSGGIETYVPYDPETGRPRPEWSSTVIESAAVLRAVPASILIENTGRFSRGRRTLLTATPEALEGSIIGYTLEVLGVGTALQNMWLAAEAYGLGAVFMGDILIAEAEIGTRLQIECDLMGVLALGYCEGRPGPSTRGQNRDVLASDEVRWLGPHR